jgi:pilus assembly protein Flp/PilA
VEAADRLLHRQPRGKGVGRRQPMIRMILERMSQNEEGQGLAEYALILALIAIVAVLSLLFLGNQISDILNNVGSSI